MQEIITTDRIEVMIAIGVEEDEDIVLDEHFIIEHADFEKWLIDNDRLTFDDTEHSAGYDGEHVQTGVGIHTVSYTEFLMYPHIYDQKSEILQYLIDKKFIPPYKVIDL